MNNINKDIHTIISKYYNQPQKIWIVNFLGGHKDLETTRFEHLDFIRDTELEHALYRVLKFYIRNFILRRAWTLTFDESKLLFENNDLKPVTYILEILKITTYDDFKKKYLSDDDFRKKCNDAFDITELCIEDDY